MKHSTIIKRPDGSRVMIDVRFKFDYTALVYEFWVYICEPKKRTWKCATNHDDYMWRRLDRSERDKEDLRRKLLHVTPEEVQQAMLELWEKNKPDFKL